MGAQTLVVFAVVLGCSLYALWVLLPAVVRRFLARQLLRLPLPPSAQRVFRRAATVASGCDCSGCDNVVAAPRQPAAPQVVHFHPPARNRGL